MPLHNGQVPTSSVVIPEPIGTAYSFTNFTANRFLDTEYVHGRSRWRDTAKEQRTTRAERREKRRRRREAVTANRAIKRRKGR